MTQPVFVERLNTWVPADDRFTDRWMVGKSRKGRVFGCEDMAHRVSDYFKHKNLKTFLDCGSFVGWVSRYWSDKVQQVHAWEPNPVSQMCWEKNCGHIANATLHKKGLSNIPGQAFLKFNTPGHYGNCTIDKSEGTPIEITTIDSYDFTDVDFIKIDVEGNEINLLEGAKQTIMRCKPYIQIEVNSMQEVHGHTEQQVHEWFKDMGMTCLLQDQDWDFLYGF